jgi:hypothetical protein
MSRRFNIARASIFLYILPFESHVIFDWSVVTARHPETEIPALTVGNPISQRRVASSRLQAWI